VLIPYSSLAPGSQISGAVKITLSPDITCGVPVTSCHSTMSAFQNQ